MKSVPPLIRVHNSLGGRLAVLRTADAKARRDVLRELIETVHPERVSFGKYRVRIVWTPAGEALGSLVERMATASQVA